MFLTTMSWLSNGLISLNSKSRSFNTQAPESYHINKIKVTLFTQVTVQHELQLKCCLSLMESETSNLAVCPREK